MSTDDTLDDLIRAQQALDDNAHEREIMIRHREDAICAARRTGTSVARIAELIDVDRQTIYKILRRSGFTTP